MQRDWDLKKQAAFAKESYEKREGWMKSLSHFAGKERTGTSARDAKTAVQTAESPTDSKVDQEIK